MDRSDQHKAAIGLWCRDAVTRRVLHDGLAARGYAVRDCDGQAEDRPGVVLAAVDVPDSLRERWVADGVVVVNLDDGGLIRLGGLIGRILATGDGGGRAATGMLSFSGFTLDQARMILTDTRTGAVLTLTDKERDILARLYRAGGRALDRKTLLDDVWGYADSVETHTLETHIYRLRQKLEGDPANPLILVTAENGYCLRH